MEAELEQLASEPTARYSSRVGSYEQLRAAYAHVAEAVCQGRCPWTMPLYSAYLM